MTIVQEAYAKVNLYLHICDKREDGYHILDSLVVFAKTGDRLVFEPADDLNLEITGPMADRIDGPLDDNLVMQAAHKLRALCGIKKGAHIRLEKHLPVGAGIGGGSGDAAAALKGLCQLWEVFPDPKGMDALSLSLGADVPVCMKSHATHMAGIGDITTPLPPLPNCWMVLVNPNIHVSTPQVFKTREPLFRDSDPLIGELTYEALLTGLKERHNDLYAPALALVPKIEQVMSVIAQQRDCDLARMSGSGATCFGLFANEQSAKRAYEEIKSAYPDWWVAMGQII